MAEPVRREGVVTILKSWEPRFFQLRGNTLSYFKRQPDQFRDKPRKMWQLSDLTIDYKGETRGAYYIFRVVNRRIKATYMLGTLAIGETTGWVDVLTESIRRNSALLDSPEVVSNTEQDLDLEEVPKMLQSAYAVLTNDFPWKLQGDSLWVYQNWRKCEIPITFALKEMGKYLTDSRALWDYSLQEYRVLSECQSFKLVLVECEDKRTVLMQSVVRLSTSHLVIIQESVEHVMYPNTWRLSDYMLVNKNKAAGATLITRYLKSDLPNTLNSLVTSFRSFPNFIQLTGVKADLMTFGTNTYEVRGNDSQTDLSSVSRVLGFDEFFCYGRGGCFERDDLNGGLVFLDKVLISKQKKVLGHLLRSMASNLMKGQSIINVSLPVNIFEPRGILERMLYSFGYAPIFLDQAAQASGVQRLKFVLAWALTILHCCTDQGKPFNPVIGETFQTTLGSAQCYAEQTSHHPPISNFQVYGNGYVLYGFHEWIVNIGTNSAKGRSKGRTCIKFSDSLIEVSLPWAIMNGTLFGRRIFNWTGVLSAIDHDNSLYGELIFNPNKKSMFSKSSQPSDFFKGQIAHLPPDHFVVKKDGFQDVWGSGKRQVLTPTDDICCSIEGYWPLYMDVDNDRIWSFESYRPFLIGKVLDPLPSDSRFRSDIIELAKGNEEAAQVMKEKLENLQRRDKQLQDQYRKSMKQEGNR